MRFHVGQRIRVLKERLDMRRYRLTGAVGTIRVMDDGGRLICARLDPGTFEKPSAQDRYCEDLGVWFDADELAPLMPNDNEVEE